MTTFVCVVLLSGPAFAIGEAGLRSRSTFLEECGAESLSGLWALLERYDLRTVA
jgi:hypothetical protein